MSKFAGKGPHQCFLTLDERARNVRNQKGKEDGSLLSVTLYDLEGLLTKAENGDKALSRVFFGPGGHKPERQHLFHPLIGQIDTGNCYQVCMATVLGVPVSAVPHFYSVNATVESANRHIGTYLALQQRMTVTYMWPSVLKGRHEGWLPFGDDVLVIVSGKSPRGDFLHAVVGVLDSKNANGWKMIHDPHPSDAGIVGDPESIEFIVVFPKVIK